MSIMGMEFFPIVRGDNLPVTITFKDSLGNPINIAGSTVFFTVKNSNSDADAQAVIAKSWTEHSLPDQGITDGLFFVPADTSSLSGRYLFDLQIKLVSGLVYTPVHGIFLVIEDTTLRTS